MCYISYNRAAITWKPCFARRTRIWLRNVKCFMNETTAVVLLCHMIILMSMRTCLHIFLFYHNLLTGFAFNILQFKIAREGNNKPSPEIYIKEYIHWSHDWKDGKFNTFEQLRMYMWYVSQDFSLSCIMLDKRQPSITPFPLFDIQNAH